MIKPQTSTKWYTVLLSFTIILPVLYLIYLAFIIQGSNQSVEVFLNEQPMYVVLFMISLINPIWGHILNLVPKDERVKKGRADKILTFMLVSEIIVGNVIIAILVFITKRQLSLTNNGHALTNFEKTAAIFLLLFSILSGLILLRLTIITL